MISKTHAHVCVGGADRARQRVVRSSPAGHTLRHAMPCCLWCCRDELAVLLRMKERVATARPMTVPGVVHTRLAHNRLSCAIMVQLRFLAAVGCPLQALHRPCSHASMHACRGAPYAVARHADVCARSVWSTPPCAGACQSTCGGRMLRRATLTAALPCIIACCGMSHPLPSAASMRAVPAGICVVCSGPARWGACSAGSGQGERRQANVAHMHACMRMVKPAGGHLYVLEPAEATHVHVHVHVPCLLGTGAHTRIPERLALCTRSK